VAHDIVDHRDRIVRQPHANASKLLVKGTHISVEHVLASLAANPDVDALCLDHPELSREDVRAVLAYARDRIQADDEQAKPTAAVSPQQFYADITRRPDVAELMRRLAR
jgi:uncharacterized protein (DUF433 family)